MATTADLRNGIVIEYKNDLYKVVDFQHVKPGKGSAFVRTKLRDVRGGNTIEKTFRAGDRHGRRGLHGTRRLHGTHQRQHSHRRQHAGRLVLQ